MATKKKKSPWSNRIVGYGSSAPDQLLANEANWRVHPKAQREALSGAMHDIGILQNVIVNKRTSERWQDGQRGVETVVDGHLRISLALSEGQPSIPVTYVDLSPDEERLALATIDPLSAMAVADKEQLDALLREVNTDSAALQAMLAEVAKSNYLNTPEFKEYDESAADDVEMLTCPKCGHAFPK